MSQNIYISLSNLLAKKNRLQSKSQKLIVYIAVRDSKQSGVGLS
jgi:hypothetical protein